MNAELNLYEQPHRRFNALTGEWMLVSPHRAKRPWQGQQESAGEVQLPDYEPTCYLCPGNERTSGARNELYETTYVFDNDFQALLHDTKAQSVAEQDFILAESVCGVCRVICFSPRHDLTLAKMSESALMHVVQLWVDQYQELSQQYPWVQIFENRGEAMGCSSPHPHGQIWCLDAIPEQGKKEQQQQQHYYAKHKSPLLVDYAKYEAKQGVRTVVENEHWLVVVPYWAMWPFETLMLPKRHVPHFLALTAEEQTSLANIVKQLTAKYDNLFNTSFPYSMGWHNSPDIPGSEGAAVDAQAWQLHAHFYPPLLRSASIKKFMVGFEMLGEPQRDLTAEQAAARLRELPTIHYSER